MSVNIYGIFVGGRERTDTWPNISLDILEISQIHTSPSCYLLEEFCVDVVKCEESSRMVAILQIPIAVGHNCIVVAWPSQILLT